MIMGLMATVKAEEFMKARRVKKQHTMYVVYFCAVVQFYKVSCHYAGLYHPSLTKGSFGSFVGCGRNTIPFFEVLPSTM